MPVILLTNHYDGKPLRIIKEALPSGFNLVCLHKAEKNELLSKAGQAEYLLASGRIPIDRDVLEAASKLKMIQRTGVGLDSLDLDGIKERNIPIYVNQGINSRSVAEHTILLMLATLRRLPVVNANVKNGRWEKQKQGVENYELYGKTVGLIGMGNIGRAVAKMLGVFGAKVLYYDPLQLADDVENALGIRYTPLVELMQQVDIVSLHCPLTAQTLKLIGKEQLALMKNGAIVINTARGGLIDEEALIQCLQSGQVATAGLDVYNEEPLAKNNPLLMLDNVILTPHIGGITYDSFHAMMIEAMNNMRLFEEGKLEQIANKRWKI